MTLSPFPRLPLGEVVEEIVNWISSNLGWLLDIITRFLTALMTVIYGVLSSIPPLIFIIIIAIAAAALKFRNSPKRNSVRRRVYSSIDLSEIGRAHV